MHSGWSARLSSGNFRNADADGTQHYPGFHVEAAMMLLEETNAASLASDTLSIDIGASQTFDTHYSWLPAGRFAIENIANLDRVPAAGATLVIGAPNHRGGSGGPARIFAML
jgi:kynurenine formamidase